MHTLPPSHLAQIDQLRARLTHLVKLARDHQCPDGPLCLGEANNALHLMPLLELEVLLQTAIAELAGKFR